MKAGTFSHIGKSFLLTRDIKCSTALEIERGLKRSHACKVAKNRKKESFSKKCTSKVDNFFSLKDI